MERELLRKVQLTQLEIAKEIRRVCRENGIRYFLADGSFLGAVRHQGFIPWDDDMDFGMLRADYERFMQIAPEKLKPEYCVQSWYTDPNYGLPFGKVMKKNTIYLEGKKTNRLKENGFYVDIFPFDYVPEEEASRQALAGRLLKIYRIILMQCGYRPWMENGKVNWKKRLGYLYYQLLTVGKTRDQLIREYDALAKACPETGMVCEQSALPKPDYYPASLFTEYEEYAFEDTEFCGVKNYHGYLGALYGEYMQLPPEDQRENRHQIVHVDFGE